MCDWINAIYLKIMRLQAYFKICKPSVETYTQNHNNYKEIIIWIL